jgi:hypothetical protein
MQKLSIEHICDDLENRPKVSYEIRKYIEDYIMTEVLKKKNIIAKTKYDIALNIIFSSTGDTKNYADYLILKPRISKQNQLKSYSIYVPFNISRYPKPVDAYVEVLLNAICFFLEKTFKTLESFDFEELYRKVDMEYIRNIPYPAEFAEQKYIGDSSLVSKIEMNYSPNGFSLKETKCGI